MKHSARILVALGVTLGMAALPGGASAADVTENFDTVVPAGWASDNQSSTLGPTNWFQGTHPDSGGPFNAFNGAPTAYAAANFNNADSGSPATISNWLISPKLSTLTDGDA
jgi:hypothetical protein